MTQASPGVRKSEVASELISFHLSISPLPPILHGWTITSPLSPDIIDIDDTRLQEIKHNLDADGDDKNTYHDLTDHITK
jgi:hypothetical protein